MKNLITLSAITLMGIGCAPAINQEAQIQEVMTPPAEQRESSTTVGLSPEIISEYFGDRLVGTVETVECTLSKGTETDCYQFVIQPEADHAIGPWCPENIGDTDEAGGIWPEGGEINPVSGEFIANLGTFYNDDEWNLYDAESGKINVTNSLESCEGAAKPDVDEEYQNHCVQCELSYMDEIPNVTYTIPVTPVTSETAVEIQNEAGIGVAFNGIKFDAPAPTENILEAHTIAPFDDCGGHINLHVGYHYHEHNGCSVKIEKAENEALIGIALDGFGIYEENEEATLDECGGHLTEDNEYHYHINETGSNQFLNCFRAESGCATSDGSTSCDASASSTRGAPGGGPEGLPGEPPEGGPERG